MQVHANGIAIEVDVQGPPEGKAVLLVMGLGMQLLGWPQGLVDALVAAGYRVIRFDNRDIGLSASFDAAGTPRLAVDVVRHLLRRPLHPAYTLADMADDAVGVLDALGVARAHVWGASMGGMIAQHIASRHPTRTHSLLLMMTTSGARRLPGPRWDVLWTMLGKPADARDVDAVVAHYRRFFGVIGSPRYPTPPDVLDAQVRQAVLRSYRPDGTLRQLLAIAADGDRSALLARLRVPTHVLHGSADRMLPLPNALDLQRRVDGATLEVVPGMGHDLPAALWPTFVGALQRLAARGSAV